MKICSVLFAVLFAGVMAAGPAAFAAGGGGGGSAGGAAAGAGSTSTAPSFSSGTVTGTANGRSTQGSLSTNGGGPIQNGNDIAPAEAPTQSRERNLGIAPSAAESHHLNAAVEQDASKLIRQSQAGLTHLPPGVAQSLPPGEVRSH